MKGKKTGGRVKGTENKVTRFTREVLANIIDKYQSTGQLDADLLMLEPKDRLVIMERFMQYTLPKMQSVSVDVDGGSVTKTIEDKLRAHMEETESK
jgi:hypothetical protein